MTGLGALQSLAFAHPQAWVLPLIGVAGLAWRVRLATPARAALLGAVYGTAWVASATAWLYISLHRYGGLPAWLAAGAVLLLALVLSGYLALAMAGVARAARRLHGRGSFSTLIWPGLFAAAWLAAELARGLLFTGFPWAASGYAQVDGPLAWLAPWVGVYGIGAISAGLAAWAVEAACRRSWRAVTGWLLAVAAVAVGALIGPVDFTTAQRDLRVTLLQPNVAQDEKFVAQHLPATLAWVSDALLAARGDLVVAPETAIPLLPGQLQDMVPGYWSALQAHFAAADSAAGKATERPAALVGVPLGDPQAGYTNSVVGLNANRSGYRYDKVHLVPFGEFIPPAFRWFTELMDIPLGDFRRGDLDAPTFVLGTDRLLPNICFEDLFGEQLARHFVAQATAPTLLVNVSNIGWFGHSAAPLQHLHISRMRSLELQRPMLRATNTGSTAIIDHRAQVLASLPGFTRGVLSGVVQGRSGVTPYARWVGVLGLWPLLGAAWLVLVWAALAAPVAARSGR